MSARRKGSATTPPPPARATRRKQQWGILDRRLEGRDYVAGGFSLADIVLGPFLHRWFELPVARRAMPGLEAYRARLHERHAGYRTHVAVPMS